MFWKSTNGKSCKRENAHEEVKHEKVNHKNMVHEEMMVWLNSNLMVKGNKETSSSVGSDDIPIKGFRKSSNVICVETKTLRSRTNKLFADVYLKNI